MVKLLEPTLEIKVRKEEVGLAESMLEECETEFSELMERETGTNYSCKLTVIKDMFLDESNGARCGGVILYAKERRIVCSNTLEDRLNLVFELELPRLRHILFPKK